MKYVLPIFVSFFAVGNLVLHAQDIRRTPHEDDVPRPVPVETTLAGAEQPDISRFLNARRAFSPSLSPDGARLAFQTTITGKPQLWVVDARGGWPRQLTFGESVTFHRWSPAGDWIIYGTDSGGNEREGYYLITPDGLRERELLAPSDAFRVFGGFSRDGRRVAYATTSNGPEFDVHTIDIASGEDRSSLEGRMGLYVVSWRPDGRAVILSESRGEDANDVYLLELDKKNLTTLFKPDVASQYGSFAWTPDGEGFFLVTDQDREYRALAYFSVDSGDLSFLETPTNDVESVEITNDGTLLTWTVNDGGYSRLHARRLQPGWDFTEAGKIATPKLPEGIYRVAWAPHSHVASISVNGPRLPGDIWTWNADTGDLFRATLSSTAGIDTRKLVVPRHYSFKARDGVTIHGLFYHPDNVKGGAKPPVLLAVHGGPTAQARPRFNPAHQYLLKRGVAVFDLNFRGSTGYGKTFARLNDRRLRANEYHDMADAVEWLGRQGLVDADRAAVMGRSYGGYLTMAALARLPDHFDAGIAFVGVSNWGTALEGASPQLKASDRLEYGDIDNASDRQFFESISPISHVKKIRAPLMVLHGVNDPRVPVEESDQFVRGIREGGGSVEYLRFPDEGHTIRNLSNRIIAYRRIADFLERTIGHASAKHSNRNGL